jgi:hypothetical protein
VTELTDFYKHLSIIIENLIEKFSSQEKIVYSLAQLSQNNPSKTMTLPSLVDRK